MVAVALLVAVGTRAFVAQAFYIPSASMVPQLQVDDRVVVSKLAYRFHAPRRGDVVVFEAPDGARPGPSSVPLRLVRAVLGAVGLVAPSTEDYIKRVVALPHERVEARDGRVLVDGRPLVEPYLPAGDLTADFGPVLVGGGQLFVLGDNRGNSDDSRIFGPVSRSALVGRAVVRMWPPTRAAFL